MSGSGSGSSNTTKTTSTDNSSRHSNVSTAPSSADFTGQDEWRGTRQKHPSDAPLPPIPKPSSSSGSFLRAAGRTFSFGAQRRHIPSTSPADSSPSPTQPYPEEVASIKTGRARATTTSTSTTVTPPALESGFNLDLGGDFSKMLAFEKRQSTMTLRDDTTPNRPLSDGRSLTGNRTNQPSPIQINNYVPQIESIKAEATSRSWDSEHSNDGLLVSSPIQQNSPTTEQPPQPTLPSYSSPASSRPFPSNPNTTTDLKRTSAVYARRASATEEVDSENARLLTDSASVANKFVTGVGIPSFDRPGDSTLRTQWRRHMPSDSRPTNVRPTNVRSTNVEPTREDDIFDQRALHPIGSVVQTASRKTVSTQNKVMTPAQFEKYRKDKESQGSVAGAEVSSDKSDDEDHYDDDEDDAEKARQQAKQRRKQEAHMTVYRQQMMKVTGESAASQTSSRQSLQLSFSTPNLPTAAAAAATAAPIPGNPPNQSDGSDEDEEIPLAILAAHGFPNKNRPPTRLSTAGSNPNLRAPQQASNQRPDSVVGDTSAANRNSRLPAFARKLPQDPFLGAGLVNNPVRESFSLGGGAAPTAQTAGPGNQLPPGGLVGVIANEERSRAMRRGSPHIDNHSPLPSAGSTAFDPIGGIPPHMMYQQRPPSTMLTPGDHAQIQMTQQMQQFMQMQMQFMQMMSGQGGNASQGLGNGLGHQSTANLGDIGSMPGMGGMTTPDATRHSFVGNSTLPEPPRLDPHMRTMSMVQPSSASWIQPMSQGGYSPSIRTPGTGYTPSIAPSERSNVGLPGRYRPVSHVPPPTDSLPRASTMSGALTNWNDKQHPTVTVQKYGSSSDDDDEEGWQAMKMKREKKRSLWRSKKHLDGDISALIT